jgi:uncharacterized protein
VEVITPVYAALLGIMLVILSVRVILVRRAAGISIGDNGNQQLHYRIRTQGNFAEYTPFFILLLGLAEHQGLAHWAVHLCGFAFIIGRFSHFYAFFLKEQNRAAKGFRETGMGFTFTPIIILSLVILFLTYA